MKNENPVIWFEIYVDDMDRAKSFYEKVFQIKLSQLSSPNKNSLKMWAFPGDMENKNRASGSLVQVPGVKAGGNSTVVYFASPDCSIEEARIADAGGTLVRSKTSIGEYGFITLARDSEGNMIGIHSLE